MVNIVKRVAGLVTKDPAEMIAQLESRLADARAAVEEATAEFNEASYAVETGEPDAIERKKQAHKVLSAASAAVTDLEAASAAATLRQQEADAAARIREWNRKWDAVAKHAAARADLVGEIETAVEKLAELLARFEVEVGNMVGACPVYVDQDGALAGSGRLTAEVQLAMKRNGIQWAAPAFTQWDAQQRPSFSELVRGGNEFLLRKRALTK